MDKDKFQILQLLVDISEKESDRTWKRYSIMLTINSALISFFTFSGTELDLYVKIAFCLFGIFFSVIWRYIIIISKYYEKRWHLDIEALIGEDEMLNKYIKARPAKSARIPKPIKLSSTGLSKLIPIGFIILWILFIANEIVKFCL
ncbi:hypothetical protein ACE1ET_17495 [Saccharicrinis sp. FJH62]|uniref:RipA family octameric membrane protein n=1 Tax=Saccharicrinis sp. FJH62 TaxID=3344657 RepID=UPI0035D470D3